MKYSPNINLSNFTCLLVDFGEVLCSSANEFSSSRTQMLLFFQRSGCFRRLKPQDIAKDWIRPM